MQSFDDVVTQLDLIDSFIFNGLYLPGGRLTALLPVGISFFTFQSMSYTIDIYRRELAPVKSFSHYLLFVSFFPQLVAGPIVRAFNAAYFRRVPEAGRTVVKPISDFFFPLDRIHDWNRLYGKRGFHQFQCVVPGAAKGQLKTMMQEIAGAGLASPLAVLKRMGPGRAGYLSFPMEGYTLAVDFPNRGRAAGLIGRLIDMTAEAGGRIYFAKDLLARAEQIGAMYPDLGKWQAAVAKADPGGIFETDMTRRLGLRGSE